MEDVDKESLDERGYCDLRFGLYDKFPSFAWSDRIVKLDLSSNRISEIPSKIAALQLLEDLDLSNNRLENIDDDIGLCIRLRRLNFSNNALRSIPKSLFKCIMLETIMLGNNKIIRSLPYEICRLPTLKRLEIQKNCITFIPCEIAAIVSM